MILMGYLVDLGQEVNVSNNSRPDGVERLTSRRQAEGRCNEYVRKS
jgi:hypothetical protein